MTTTTKTAKAAKAHKADTKPEATTTTTTEETKVATPEVIAAHVRQTLENAAAVFNDAATLQSQLNAKRDGGYNTCLNAAREAVTADVLSGVWDGFKADIRADVSGVAKRLGCTLGKPDSNGKAEYKVPGSLSTAMSVILGAMRAGVSLYVKEKDGKTRPATFGEVRQGKAEADKAEAEAKAKAALETASPAVKARAEIARLARLIAEGAGNFTEAEAIETAKILESVYRTMDGSKNHKPDAAKAA